MSSTTLVVSYALSGASGPGHWTSREGRCIFADECETKGEKEPLPSWMAVEDSDTTWHLGLLG